jgi:hypothetical protein
MEIASAHPRMASRRRDDFPRRAEGALAARRPHFLSYPRELKGDLHGSLSPYLGIRLIVVMFFCLGL